MCNLLALGIAGTAISAAGSLMQGAQANAAAQAQARAQEQQAEAERRSSAFEQEREFKKQQLQMSNARAQVGASGVGFQGSPTAVLAANASQGQLDLAAIQYGSQLRQNTLMTQADLTRMEGRQARTAGFINAASSVVSGASGIMRDRAVRLNQNPFARGGLY